MYIIPHITTLESHSQCGGLEGEPKPSRTCVTCKIDDKVICADCREHDEPIHWRPKAKPAPESAATEGEAWLLRVHGYRINCFGKPEIKLPDMVYLKDTNSYVVDSADLRPAPPESEASELHGELAEVLCELVEARRLLERWRAEMRDDSGIRNFNPLLRDTDAFFKSNKAGGE